MDYRLCVGMIEEVFVWVRGVMFLVYKNNFIRILLGIVENLMISGFLSKCD